MKQYRKLRSAIENNKYNKLVSLIEAGVDLNVRYPDDNSETPLSLAVAAGSARMVELLLKNGADPDTPLRSAYHPIHIATKFGQLEIVKLLVIYGARADTICALNGDYPIHVAAHNGYIHLIDFYLKLGIDIESTNYLGCTPLHRAADSFDRLLLFCDDSYYERCVVHGHVAPYHYVIRYLVEKGANIFQRNKDGETPLHICARRCFVDGIKFLVEKGAFVEVKNNSDFTPVEEFFRCFTNFTSAQILIKYLLLQSKRPYDQYNIRDIFYDTNYPDRHPYTKALTIFLENCKEEIKMMESIKIRNTTISLHTFLQDLFHDARFITHLKNENIRKEFNNIEECLNGFPTYSSVNITVKDKIETFNRRINLVERACEGMNNKITPILPSEIKQKILNYLSDLDLIDFINAINSCDNDPKCDLNPLRLELFSESTKSYTRKNNLSAFISKIFRKS